VTWGLIAAALLTGWLSYRHPWWRRPLGYQHPRILMYHMVPAESDHGRPRGLAVPAHRFDRQVAYLRRSGWHFATVSELLEGPILPKTVAITFDDGYADNLTSALPVLLRHKAKATVYLIADRQSPLSEGGLPDGAPLAELLSDDQVKELLDSGVVELGSHTSSHVNLANADPARCQRELIESKHTLEHLFQRDVSAFAYPFGATNDSLADLAEQAGYRSAVTTQAGVPEDLDAQRFRLKRIRISGRDNMINFRIRLRIGRRR